MSKQLLLDTLPKSLKIKHPKPPPMPTIKDIQNEYMPAEKQRSGAKDKTFKQVMSQIKLLDTSKSCRMLQALYAHKPRRFKLQGSSSTKDYQTPVANRRQQDFQTTEKPALLYTAQSFASLHSCASSTAFSSANTPVKPSREIRMLVKP